MRKCISAKVLREALNAMYLIMFIRTYNVASLRTPYPSKFVSVSNVDLLYNNNIIVYDIKMIHYIIR